MRRHGLTGPRHDNLCPFTCAHAVRDTKRGTGASKYQVRGSLGAPGAGALASGQTGLPWHTSPPSPVRPRHSAQARVATAPPPPASTSLCGPLWA